MITEENEIVSGKSVLDALLKRSWDFRGSDVFIRFLILSPDFQKIQI